ncbi:MAG: sensor domain-containing diguanylate cyclase [Gallionella sp.]|nr:sensor domain-containing diguanylate cyclase [Gallionella sp.]
MPKFAARLQYLDIFIGAFALNLLIIFSLWGVGEEKFVYLHLVFDTSNAILSMLLAVFLSGERHAILPRVRHYLVIAFCFAAATELLHALVGIEWEGSFAWIETYSGMLRPATWPPSTYVLPLAMAWSSVLIRRNATLSPVLFAAGMAGVTLALYVLSFGLPSYVDIGILGIRRPTQLPLLLLWAVVIAIYWRRRHEHRLYEGLAMMGALLFLSDVCMLFSTSPHEHYTMMAHAGKLIAYVMLHVIQMRIAAEDSQARDDAELALHEEKNRLKIALKEINQLAFYDELTGLANRRLLNDRLQQTLAARQRAGRYAALIFIDLDNFKPLNDVHGHTTGDLLLVSAAGRITACVRETDTVARFGGDEFVVILGDLSADRAESISQALVIAEKIRVSLGETYRLTLNSPGAEEALLEHHCTSSIGLAVFNRQHSPEEVIVWADTAMYQAKDEGRNLIRVYQQR